MPNPMTPASQRPTVGAGLRHRPEIDGLRALAVLPVILFHAGFNLFGGGYVGVDVFFVISGFLITSIMVVHVVYEAGPCGFVIWRHFSALGTTCPPPWPADRSCPSTTHVAALWPRAWRVAAGRWASWRDHGA